ncbi:MAG: hypothetical protein J7M34_14380 [Anaerolineae bacterium]|nr:hypothetical protein [Anaerolineae bacterium]
MIPIEVLWGTLTASFGFIGLARGYPRELGVTTVVLAAILILKQFGETLLNLINDQLGFQILQGPNSDLIQFLIYDAIFLAIVFASYAGETLTFKGRPMRGYVGSLISLTNGLINGYLVNGTAWYYMDRYHYPIQQWGLFQPPLTSLAQEIVQYLPPRVLSITMLIGLVGLLLVLRVRK